MKKFFLVILILAVLVGVGSYAVLKLAPESTAADFVRDGLIVGRRGWQVTKDHVRAAWDQVRGKEMTVVSVTPTTTEAGEEAPAKPAVQPPPPPPPPREWKGLESANWYCGKKLTEKSFAGKIVMVYEFSLSEADSVALLPRLEQLWSAYKTKPFLLLGSHRGGKSAQVAKLVKKARLTFPVYEEAGRVKEPPAGGRYPLVYVENDAGKIIYRGRSELEATEAFIDALPSVGSTKVR